MRKAILNYSWILLLTVLMCTQGADAAILPAEQQILQKAGINVNDYPDWRFETNSQGRITAVHLYDCQLTSLPLALLELPYVEVIELNNNQIAGNIGTLASTYAQTHPTLSQHFRKLNFENNRLTGDIGPLVALLDPLPEIQEINAQGNSIRDISVIPETEAFRVWVDNQTISDLSVTFNPDTQTPADLMALLPSITLYNPWDRVMDEYETVSCYIDDESVMDIHVSGDGFSVWTKEGLRALGWREDALYDSPHADAQCQLSHPRHAHQPPGPRVHPGLQQQPGAVQGQHPLRLPRP